jgi:hypothetical protein
MADATVRIRSEHRSKNDHRQIEEKHGNLRCHIKPQVPEVVPPSTLSDPRNISLFGRKVAGYSVGDVDSSTTFARIGATCLGAKAACML